ncbi:MAG: GlyGly-CTERM sorting domain-containing protein [Gammaproteobacteria bacterium]|nr:GlyGly-CTERM sorting domain-containing protein [Gammaproteobacteria bacterium]
MNFFSLLLLLLLYVYSRNVGNFYILLESHRT